MRRSLPVATLLAALLTLSACGGDATGSATGTLTRAEAAALSRATLAYATGAAAGSVPGSRRAVLAGPRADRLTYSFDTTQPCAPGGSVGLAGSMDVTYDPATQAGQLRSDLSVRHQGCVHPVREGGTVELSGDPDLDFVVTARSGAQGVTELRVAETGAFTWKRADGNGGRCTVDLVAELVAGTQQVRTTGTFCGFPVDATFQGD